MDFKLYWETQGTFSTARKQLYSRGKESKTGKYQRITSTGQFLLTRNGPEGKQQEDERTGEKNLKTDVLGKEVTSNGKDSGYEDSTSPLLELEGSARDIRKRWWEQDVVVVWPKIWLFTSTTEVTSTRFVSTVTVGSGNFPAC